MGKLINRITSSRLLISSLPGSALRTHVESLGKPRDVNIAFSKPCLVNLVSKDTHLVFSIFMCMYLLHRVRLKPRGMIHLHICNI